MGKYIVELDDIYRSITAYKLVKRRKDGTFGPLYIDCRHHFEIGEWQEAKYDIIKPGYAVRPGWHTCKYMSAPHIKPRPERYWMKVKVADYIEFQRPDGQGGTWFLSKWIKPLNIISKYECECKICKDCYELRYQGMREYRAKRRGETWI